MLRLVLFLELISRSKLIPSKLVLIHETTVLTPAVIIDCVPPDLTSTNERPGFTKLKISSKDRVLVSNKDWKWRLWVVNEEE